MSKVDIYTITSLLDDSPETNEMYRLWDLGDCSLIGLLKILLKQEINKEIKSRGQYYDGEFKELESVL